jgi:exopolysaccharide biosynthesis polyprenyl glycosylphosphotransferase
MGAFRLVSRVDSNERSGGQLGVDDLRSKVRTREATSANASVSPPNFAVPAKLPEPGPGPRGRRRRETITDREFAMVQACTDFVCACLALPISLLILSVFSTATPNASHLLWSNLALDSLFPVAAVVALTLGGIYRSSHRKLQPSAFMEMRDLSFGVGSGCVLALAIGAFAHAALGSLEPNPTQLVFAVIISVIVMTTGRSVMRYFLHTLTTSRVLVVGSGKMAQRVMMSVRQNPGMTLVGRVSDGEDVEAGVIGVLRDLPILCPQLGVHRVLVAAPGEVSETALNTYRRLQESVHVAVVPQYFELVSWRSRLTDLSGMPFLEIARPHLSPWDRMAKRMFDICISSFVLLVTSPLLLIVAFGVKLSSPGPVFFRQVRLGRGRVPFTITKFRTMTVDTSTFDSATSSDLVNEEVPLHELHHKEQDQGRITRFGAFLRHTGIDEIPQFINVFKGDMAVVGPRPFVPAESGVAGWGSRRFEVRPGITGLWQVSGRNDLSRSDLVQLDYLYVASWSMWWDLKIMWETPRTMAKGVGAY